MTDNKCGPIKHIACVNGQKSAFWEFSERQWGIRADVQSYGWSEDEALRSLLHRLRKLEASVATAADAIDDKLNAVD